MALVYLVQHAQKIVRPGDPELTELGRDQATQTGQCLSDVGLRALYSSPLRRAWQTAEAIAHACGLEIRLDDRLRERMNWDGTQPIEAFIAEWTRCVEDRDFVPRSGDSSRQAGARLAASLQDLGGQSGPIAVVSHGGVTVDLLRTLLGDDALPKGLLQEGVPSCAITIFDGLKIVSIAETSHLAA